MKCSQGIQRVTNSTKFAAFLLCAGPILGSAQETAEIDTTLEDISGQYAECAAYYRLVYHAMISSNEIETANDYRQLEDTAMFYSLLLANEGRSQDLAVEVTDSRIEMYMKLMKRETDNRNENISILINKYHFGCQDAMENPSSQVVTVLQRSIEEENK